jgi:hypothetical protein
VRNEHRLEERRNRCFQFFFGQIAHSACKWPNDPKLSDGGAWRGSCVVERREGIRTTKEGGSDERRPDKK